MADYDVKTLQDLLKVEQGWTDMMVTIWQEKLAMFRINRTGALRASLNGMLSPGPVATIQHKFFEYGMYVAKGVGKGYRHGNGGDLEILGRPSVVKRTGKAVGGYMTSGQHRQRRDWVTSAYRRSVRKLNDLEGEFYGTAYLGLMADALQTMSVI